jgi:hypothetical protein
LFTGSWAFGPPGFFRRETLVRSDERMSFQATFVSIA